MLFMLTTGYCDFFWGGGGGGSVMWVTSKLCYVRAYSQNAFGLP